MSLSDFIASVYPPYYLTPLSAVSFNISTAFFIMEGIGTPIIPAFSTIESTSFAINPVSYTHLAPMILIIRIKENKLFVSISNTLF